MYCDETNTPFTAGREKRIKWRNKDREITAKNVDKRDIVKLCTDIST